MIGMKWTEDKEEINMLATSTDEFSPWKVAGETSRVYHTWQSTLNYAAII